MGTHASPRRAYASASGGHPLESQYGESMNRYMGNIPKGEWESMYDIPDAKLDEAYMQASMHVFVKTLNVCFSVLISLEP